MLASRNTRRYPLLWFDEANNVNKPMRYASNQKSPFEDEQDDNAFVEPIIFEDGFLRVPRTNPVLQEFLYYHPMNNVVFEEVDKEKDAQEEVDSLNVEVEALVRARELSVEELEVVYRVLFNRDTSRISTSEMKRDILVYARNYPVGFLNAIDDPSLNLQSEVQIFFDKGLLTFRNNNKEVWYSTPSNRKKMLTVPFGEDPYEIVTMFLKTDEGIEALKMLEHHMENM